MSAQDSMYWFAWLCLLVGIPYLLWSLWHYCLAMAQFMALQEEEKDTTMTDTALAREQKLDIYDDALTAFANMTVLGMPVNVSLRSDEFQMGFALGVQTIANLAEQALEAADAVTGEHVDMTDDEKARAERAVSLIHAYVPE